eukprot:403345401
MILTVDEDYDKQHGTDLPMFSRVGKTTVSMYIAFSQAAMNKKEMEEFMKSNPGVDIEEYKKRQLLKKRNPNVHDNMDDLAKQRQKFLLKQTLTMDDIDKFFLEVKSKRREDKERLDSEKRAREDSIKNSLNNTHNSYADIKSQRSTGRSNNHTHHNSHYFSNAKGTSQFKSISRDQREQILSNTLGHNENMPEVGKYTPKYNVIRGKTLEEPSPSTQNYHTPNKRYGKQYQDNLQSPTNAQINLQNQHSIIQPTQPENQFTTEQSPTKGGNPQNTDMTPKSKRLNPKSLKNIHSRQNTGLQSQKVAYQNIPISPKYHMVINKFDQANIASTVMRTSIFSQNIDQVKAQEIVWTHSPKQVLQTHVKGTQFEKVPGRGKDFQSPINQKTLSSLKQSQVDNNQNTLMSMSHTVNNFSELVGGFAQNQTQDLRKASYRSHQVNDYKSLAAQTKTIEFDKMLARTDFFVKPPATQANYKPNQEYVMEKTLRGILDFKQMSGRQRQYNSHMMKVNDGTNQTASSLNYDKVLKAQHTQIAHLPKKVVSPNLKQYQGRDLSIYMQTEALKNVLNDNYRMQVEQHMQLEQETQLSYQTGKKPRVQSGKSSNSHARKLGERHLRGSLNSASKNQLLNFRINAARASIDGKIGVTKSGSKKINNFL